MPIAFTSREALARITARMGRQHRLVYDFIAAWQPDTNGSGPSIADIGDTLDMQHSTASRCVNNLLKDGSIELAPVKTNASGMRAKTYRALVYKEFSPPPAPQVQADLFAGTARAGLSPYSTQI